MPIARVILLLLASWLSDALASTHNHNHSHRHKSSAIDEPAKVNQFNDKDLELAEQRMKDFLAGEASIWVYLAGIVAIVLFLCFIVGIIIWACSMIFSCCMCTNRFFGCFGRAVKWFFCFVFRRRRYSDVAAEIGVNKKRCLSSYQPHDNVFDEPDEECVNSLVSMTNARGVKVLTPYCEAHIGTLPDKVFKKAKPFESPSSRYSLNVYFTDIFEREPAAFATLVEAAIKVANSAPKAPRGFVYIFRSRDDLEASPYVADSKPYFFKIGMTHDKTAKERVDQWSGSVFGNVEGVDFWRVVDASRAEVLVHTLLARERVARFNKRDNKFEVEWFFQSRDQIRNTIVGVVEAVQTRNFDNLLRRI